MPVHSGALSWHDTIQTVTTALSVFDVLVHKY